MAKDLEAANKSLLEKREASQTKKKNSLQSLRSMIENGGAGRARVLALKLLLGEHKDAIIELFKSVGIEAGENTFICQRCKKKSDSKYNPLFLRYDASQTNCQSCEEFIEDELDKLKKLKKMAAAERFKKKHDEVIGVLIKESKVPELFQGASINDLDCSTAKMLSADQSYFIMGDVGVGKSHMAVAIMREYLKTVSPQYNEKAGEYRIEFSVREENILPLFVEVPELLLRIRDTYNEGSNETEKDIVEHFTRTPFLVLDDLGSEKASEFSTLMLYLIINRRCTQNKTTIITSNLNLEEIKERLSNRISSRIKGMCRELTVSGRDKRAEKRHKLNDD